MDILNNDPIKQAPAGENINDLAKEINWPIPTWIERGLHTAEFASDDQLVVDMLNAMGDAIERAMQSGAADSETIEFTYYRKKGDQRKKHPLELAATLYEHPDYGTIWLNISYSAN